MILTVIGSLLVWVRHNQFLLSVGKTQWPKFRNKFCMSDYSLLFINTSELNHTILHMNCSHLFFFFFFNFTQFPYILRRKINIETTWLDWNINHHFINQQWKNAYNRRKTKPCNNNSCGQLRAGIFVWLSIGHHRHLCLSFLHHSLMKLWPLASTGITLLCPDGGFLSEVEGD